MFPNSLQTRTRRSAFATHKSNLGGWLEKSHLGGPVFMPPHLKPIRSHVVKKPSPKGSPMQSLSMEATIFYARNLDVWDQLPKPTTHQLFTYRSTRPISLPQIHQQSSSLLPLSLGILKADFEQEGQPSTPCLTSNTILTQSTTLHIQGLRKIAVPIALQLPYKCMKSHSRMPVIIAFQIVDWPSGVERLPH